MSEVDVVRKRFHSGYREHSAEKAFADVAVCLKEIDRLQEEVEQMRPVVDAAEAWAQVLRDTSTLEWSASGRALAETLMQTVDALKKTDHS